jgi:hypothetical protein
MRQRLREIVNQQLHAHWTSAMRGRHDVHCDGGSDPLGITFFEHLGLVGAFVLVAWIDWQGRPSTNFNSAQ